MLQEVFPMGCSRQKAHRQQPDRPIRRHTMPEGWHRTISVSGVNAIAEPEQFTKHHFFTGRFQRF